MTTNNNTSQTLFRFATMRNPQLSDPKNQERRFIFRPASASGEANSQFEANLIDEKTLVSICNKIDNGTINLQLYSEDDLKTIQSQEFFELAVWVSRNKSTVTKDQFDAKIDIYKSAGNTSPYLPSLEILWDNLVYQIVTQKDFYAKETIMQFLHLNHILEVYDETEECFNDIKKAKVVLPKELFKVKNTTASGSSASASKTMFNTQAIASATAHLDLKDNLDLMAAFQKIEKNYRKNADAAYKTAYKSYEAETKPLLKQLQKDTAIADNTKQILETRINYLSQMSIADPERFYANAELEMELHSLKEEILNISYPDIDIPEFEYEDTTLQIDTNAIEELLTEEQKASVYKLFNATSITTALAGISSFDEFYQVVNQNNEVLQQTVLNNTSLPAQVSTNMGGVIIPVNNLPSYPLGQMHFSVQTKGLSSDAWGIVMAFTDPSLQIVSADYKVTLNGADISSTSLNNQTFGSVLFNTSPYIPTSQTASIGGFTLQGTVVLSDGIEYILDVTLVKNSNVTDNLTKQFVFAGDALLIPKDIILIPEEPTDPENPETPNIPNEGIEGAFIPSGFGMKNIGIADYRKVEQSTYCYVEGDVAHIENIMAREYKERATRRLKRSESQTTTSSETEKEKLTDTTSTERHEMQSEIAKIMQEAKDFAAQTGFSASWGSDPARFTANANASYATHNSKEESNRQAITEAKDVTARALDRIVTKVKEERIDKILEEYEENNKHGFDNTKGSSHVVGVYRWVDKVVKNQIYNYGKRMMFEFMIPEPSKLHRLGMTAKENSENKLVKPIDPRDSSVCKIENFSALEDDLKLKFWLSKYNVEIDKKPEKEIRVTKSISVSNGETNGEMAAKSDSIDIPEGYMTLGGWLNVSHFFHPSKYEWTHIGVTVGDFYKMIGQAWSHIIMDEAITFKKKYSQKVAFAFESADTAGVTVSVSLDCILNQEVKDAWLQKAFNKIIEAYEVELEKYNQALAEARALGVEIKGSNPGFYRKIENTILRRNCISYLLDQDSNVELTFGKKRYQTTNGSSEENFLNTNIKVDKKLDQYAAFVKFMEQAFEWDIMSYYFYPFYWGERNSWPDLYQYEDNDPTFRAFMQSGMARVIVTVRPGFEEAVRHYLTTGQIWNGGEVPVIDDPLFLSIVDEMRSAEGTKEGEPWREKIPTALTILQADSIGLKVEKALPCNCEPGVKFDDQLGELCGSNFELNNNQLGQSSDKWIQISFNEMDDISFTTIQNLNEAGAFPKTYECLGNSFTIDDIPESEPSIKLYKRIADEVSQIEGVEAYPTGENGVTFKVNARLIPNFDFFEVGANPAEKKLEFSTDAETYLKITSPEAYFGQTRILDKDGQPLSDAEYADQAPFTKFLV